MYDKRKGLYGNTLGTDGVLGCTGNFVLKFPREEKLRKELRGPFQLNTRTPDTLYVTFILVILK